MYAHMDEKKISAVMESAVTKSELKNAWKKFILIKAFL